MGLSVSVLISAWHEVVKQRVINLASRTIFSSKEEDLDLTAESPNNKAEPNSPIQSNEHEGITPKSSTISRNCMPETLVLEGSPSFRNLAVQGKAQNGMKREPLPAIYLPRTVVFLSPGPARELHAAAVKLQKVYKSYRTRRNLADCAVVVEELWWKALDSAALERSSVSFFDGEKQESAVSRWARARTRVAKVGKGLYKDDKAQKLALQHWLEAIDPRHRYGHNLHLYYDVWFQSENTQPFFYWLDVGDGKEVNLQKCPRTKLQHQCIEYLGPKEREAYEVIVEDGKLVYRKNGKLVQTTEDSKWIFVLSTARALYVGQKKKGEFQHSSFLSGGATTAAGRLVSHAGILEAIWPYSGHYHPTEEHFREFISFLEENGVDLTDVKRHAYDGETPPKIAEDEQDPGKMVDPDAVIRSVDSASTDLGSLTIDNQQENVEAKAEEPVFDITKRLSCKWTTGAGPRIGCVRDYPPDLQFRALEQVNLSPRLPNGPHPNHGPIPSPRPSPKVRLSPRLAYMGLPSPRTQIAATN
ncbi:hypothetical protein Ancab_027507 [Ancistrocladus abbreviatus]